VSTTPAKKKFFASVVYTAEQLISCQTPFNETLLRDWPTFDRFLSLAVRRRRQKWTSHKRLSECAFRFSKFFKFKTKHS